MDLLKLSLCLLLVLICNAVFSNGSATFIKGSCPGGRQAGEDWNPPGCHKCYCGESAYMCYSCATDVSNVDQTTCYRTSNDDMPYPTCCYLTFKCRGDEGFDEKRLLE